MKAISEGGDHSHRRYDVLRIPRSNLCVGPLYRDILISLSAHLSLWSYLSQENV
jgi:hypothetical protein